MKIHHIGFLSKNINKSIEGFEKLGFMLKREPQSDDDRRVLIAFMEQEEYKIELVQPIDSQSEYYPLLSKYRNSPYHFCFETEDIYSSVKEFENEGYHLIHEPQRAMCVDNGLVAFLSGIGTGMIELIEQEVI